MHWLLRGDYEARAHCLTRENAQLFDFLKRFTISYEYFDAAASDRQRLDGRGFDASTPRTRRHPPMTIRARSRGDDATLPADDPRSRSRGDEPT